MILAATGHRPDKLGGYGETTFAGLTLLAESVLSEIQPTSIISGMALGWDQAWAQAGLNLKIPVVAAIPFKGQESRWPQPSQEKYCRILERCNLVVCVSLGDYSASKMQIRDEWMVDTCEVLVALWNGTASGTKNCIDYASTKNRYVLNVWDRWSRGL